MKRLNIQSVYEVYAFRGTDIERRTKHKNLRSIWKILNFYLTAYKIWNEIFDLLEA